MLHGIGEKGALQKQADKELKWNQIPKEEIHLYKEAEAKQWREHLKYKAIRIISAKEAQRVRQRVQKDRILRARFAYRDKNCAKRREDPTVRLGETGQLSRQKHPQRLRLQSHAWSSSPLEWDGHCPLVILRQPS